ncbi:ATP-dependent helicase [Vibrio sp. qd031]|uniref:ATP-dependent DNA helicase n=1 Tax=Vibrio sp. qd031 TaxID=1603038 RepID=UPI000A103F5D|nr:ATP-dependent DNA helicase [Vibrio sp. qd031]ORT50368.1 ATP-dependent helicase [Vibrio sp. qd031]
MAAVTKAFAANGALSKAITGFQARQPQIDMAEAVENAIASDAQLVVEAGTGTGKTFAYLVPALLSGKKIILSTGSKNLQEQLYHRDLPLIIGALNYFGQVTLLKGRSNYLCLERLSQQMVESHSPDGDNQHFAQLVKVRSWASSSSSGDLGECETLPEDSPAIPLITSTNDNCMGKDCPSYQDCYVLKARKKALESDLVIVNHHLFMADLAIKETGFGELIPEADVFIFDEAHQLPDIASQYFGQSLSSRQIADLGKDIEIGYRSQAKDMRQLQKVAQRITQVAQDMRILLGDNGDKGNWREAISRPEVQRQIEQMNEAFDFAQQVLKLALGRSELLDAAWERLMTLQSRLKRVCDVSITGYSYWYECSPRHFALHITPLTVADKFSEQMRERQAAWVFTSATLAVADDFTHFSQRLGLKPIKQFSLPSPFDYPNQVSFCVPRYLPEVSDPGYAKHLVKTLTPVIEANQGRCFFLCTSHAMMRELTKGFRESLDLPVLMQGETNKQATLNQFTELGNALLVATGAFWEGIDVRGDSLSCVIIDKLPFTSPDDPLLKARIEDCRVKGGEPFVDVQLPDAVIALKQGVGRLIRDKTDHGALVICDNRLVTKDYAPIFLDSLPPFTRHRSLERVIDFLQEPRD